MELYVNFQFPGYDYHISQDRLNLVMKLNFLFLEYCFFSNLEVWVALLLQVKENGINSFYLNLIFLVIMLGEKAYDILPILQEFMEVQHRAFYFQSQFFLLFHILINIYIFHLFLSDIILNKLNFKIVLYTFKFSLWQLRKFIIFFICISLWCRIWLRLCCYVYIRVYRSGSFFFSLL